MLGQQLQRAGRAGAAELAVRLVDDDQAVSGGLAQRATASGGSAVPVGLFGEGSSTTDGRRSVIRARGRVEVEGEVVGATPLRPRW